MKNFAMNYEGDDIVAFNKLLFETFPSTLFDPNYLLASELISDESTPLQHGRGGVYQFSYNNHDLVLRHYRRGGLPAKLIQDKYLWAGVSRSRAMQELQLLSVLSNLNLPAPIPAAAHIRKQGVIYQADIVTVLIPEAKTLSSILADESLSGEIWKTIGGVIKKFHQHNCNHADLNAHNILLSKNQDVYLIDFDKSNINAASDAWKMKNLERLKRSLEKLAKEMNGFRYEKENFSSLMQGYAE